MRFRVAEVLTFSITSGRDRHPALAVGFSERSGIHSSGQEQSITKRRHRAAPDPKPK